MIKAQRSEASAKAAVKAAEEAATAEVGRKEAAAKAAEEATETERRQSANLRAESMGLRQEIDRMRVQLVEQAAKMQRAEEQLRTAMPAEKNGIECGGEAAGISSPSANPLDGLETPEAAALALFGGDPELGRPSQALTTLHLGDFSAVRAVDRLLQYLAVLMAWRSDVRIGVFGFWLLCHVIYMVDVLYEQLVATCPTTITFTSPKPPPMK